MTRRRPFSLRAMLALLLGSLPLAGCSYLVEMNRWLGSYSETLGEEHLVEEATIAPVTKSEMLLRSLPPAEQKVVVSVYGFQDQTGQNKPNDTLVEYSRAVTQGGLAILNEALLDAANQGWFTVVERNGLNNLLQERKIISAMRQEYSASPKKLKPLLYAGMLLEGGIIAYDSNTVTGGIGARYLGIGGNTEHRRDVVTVYLRAISVNTGEVLLSVNTAKTIYSTALKGDVFRFVSFDKLLEFETGLTYNEPPQLAVRQAIETAVYSLIMEGAMKKLWRFADPTAQQLALQEYRMRLDGVQVENSGMRVVQPTAANQYSPAAFVATPATAAPVAPVRAAPVAQPTPQQLERLPVQAGSADPLMQQYYRETGMPTRGNTAEPAPATPVISPEAYNYSYSARQPINRPTP